MSSPKIQATKTLTNMYATLFNDCAEWSVYPYLATIKSCVSSEVMSPEELAHAVYSSVFSCVFFTVVVPVLPVATLLTMSLALIASALAVVSMVIAYPLALAWDLAEDSINECLESGYEYHY